MKNRILLFSMFMILLGCGLVFAVPVNENHWGDTKEYIPPDEKLEFLDSHPEFKEMLEAQPEAEGFDALPCMCSDIFIKYDYDTRFIAMFFAVVVILALDKSLTIIEFLFDKLKELKSNKENR